MANLPPNRANDPARKVGKGAGDLSRKVVSDSRWYKKGDMTITSWKRMARDQ